MAYKVEYIDTAKKAGWCEGFVIFAAIKSTSSEFQDNFIKTLNFPNVSNACILELTNYLNAYKELNDKAPKQLPLLVQNKILGNCEVLYSLVDYQIKVDHKYGELFIAKVLLVLSNSYNMSTDKFIQLCESYQPI